MWRSFESQARQGLAGMRWDDGDVCPAETPECARPPRAVPKYGWDKIPIFRGFLNWKNDLQLIMQVCLID